MPLMLEVKSFLQYESSRPDISVTMSSSKEGDVYRVDEEFLLVEVYCYMFPEVCLPEL